MSSTSELSFLAKTLRSEIESSGSLLGSSESTRDLYLNVVGDNKLLPKFLKKFEDQFKKPGGSRGFASAPKVTLKWSKNNFEDVFTFCLKPYQAICVGRDPSKSAVCTHHALFTVSRVHCIVILISVDYKWKVVVLDYWSMNGTKLYEAFRGTKASSVPFFRKPLFVSESDRSVSLLLGNDGDEIEVEVLLSN
jgi:hypothetical protein